MKALIKLCLVLAVLGGGGMAAAHYAGAYWERRNRPVWKTAEVERGDIVEVKNATGNVKPVLSVSVGSFVSGPIVKLNVDFNDEVKKGEILALVDPRLFQANVARDEATLATRRADVERVTALLHQARNNEDRGHRLREENEDFLSDAEMDSLTFNSESLRAQLKLSEAAVLQARALLDNSVANLEYTEIVAPVDGIVIDRKIDHGQTLAAAFQTPELFVVAPDLRKKVHVFASVDEADIGHIQRALAEQRPVTFSVDAHPDELFNGVIEQIRVSSTTVENVVTYPVVVAASNPDYKLLPGMTATISFEVDAKQGIVKIPNEALRFYPPDPKHVREADRKILEGEAWSSSDGDEESADRQSAADRTEAHRKLNRRHVWVEGVDGLRAVEVVTGLTESKFTECVSGELQPGDALVVGQQPSK